MPIKINVSSKAAEKPKPQRSFEDLPKGWFKVRITDVALEEVKKEFRDDGSKNPNFEKPMYAFEFTVTDDTEINPVDEKGNPQFEDRKDWTRACLWDGAEFTIVNIMRALGKEIEPGDLDVPDITDENDPDGGIDFFMGKELRILRGTRKKERESARRNKTEPRIEIVAFSSADGYDDDVEDDGPAVKPTGRRRVLA